jgi:hypothetical protein
LSRRVSLPAADDLFRPTAPPTDAAVAGVEDASAPVLEPEAEEKRPSGRVRHDEKMTIYVTADELFEIEQARLVLRRTHGLAVDRGRLVREAVAIALADLEDQGDHSVLVRRLNGS